jgi:hypothetical protein
MRNLNQYQLKIADIIISVSAINTKLDLIIPKTLYSFVINNNEKATILVNVYNHIPEIFNNHNIIFLADRQNNLENATLSPYNWCICSTETTKFIKIYKEQNINKPEIIASFDKNAKNWSIYFEKSYQNDNNNQIDPFSYPLGPLLFYYITTFNEGLMIHSSGVDDNNNGYIFCGLSGIGKTTISKIWFNEKALIINDDRLIIRKTLEKYYIFNTPMNYSDDSKMSTLNNIFLLKQSHKNYSLKLNGIDAIVRLMSNCIQHNYDKSLINSLISICTNICQSIPVYELGFKPDKSIVQFIRNNEFNGK